MEEANFFSPFIPIDIFYIFNHRFGILFLYSTLNNPNIILILIFRIFLQGVGLLS